MTLKPEATRFATDLDVPFTNNAAESAIHMTKIHPKVSNCFLSLTGAQGFAAIGSYLATATKHDVGALPAFRRRGLDATPDHLSGGAPCAIRRSASSNSHHLAAPRPPNLRRIHPRCSTGTPNHAYCPEESRVRRGPEWLLSTCQRDP